MARPSGLTQDVADRLVEATRKGLPRDTCAKLAGIHPATFFEWLKKGREGKGMYAELHDRVKEAEAEGESELVDIIRSAAKMTWQAAAWMLERRRPERYALTRLKMEHTIKPMTPEQAKAKFKELTGRDWGEG